MILYYVRHGDPIYNPDGLTEFGFKQAEMLKEKFSRIHVDKIFTSTSNRAYLTAKPTCDMLGINPVRLDFANEGIIGKYFFVTHDGRSTWCYNHRYWREIFNSAEVLALGDKWYNHPAFFGTGFRQGTIEFQEAQDSFFESLGYAHDREKHCFKGIRPNNDVVLFFAHGGYGNCFMSSLLDIPYNVFSTHFQEHATTGITAVKFEGDADFIIPKIVTYNETPHLFTNGVDNQYKI